MYAEECTLSELCRLKFTPLEHSIVSDLLDNHYFLRTNPELPPSFITLCLQSQNVYKLIALVAEINKAGDQDQMKDRRLKADFNEGILDVLLSHFEKLVYHNLLVKVGHNEQRHQTNMLSFLPKVHYDDSPLSSLNTMCGTIGTSLYVWETLAQSKPSVSKVSIDTI